MFRVHATKKGAFFVSCFEPYFFEKKDLSLHFTVESEVLSYE